MAIINLYYYQISSFQMQESSSFHTQNFHSLPQNCVAAEDTTEERPTSNS